MIKLSNTPERASYLASYLTLVKCANILEQSEVDSSITDFLTKESERYMQLYLDCLFVYEENEPNLFSSLFSDLKLGEIS